MDFEDKRKKGIRENSCFHLELLKLFWGYGRREGIWSGAGGWS